MSIKVSVPRLRVPRDEYLRNRDSRHDLDDRAVEFSISEFARNHNLLVDIVAELVRKLQGVETVAPGILRDVEANQEITARMQFTQPPRSLAVILKDLT